ncbi:hypothetical protein FXO38_33093 [Capsicum annuum]|nr:hypothetical protein FXO38_33093 [Capsicum annuum]
MLFFVTLRSAQILSDPKVIDRIKKEWVGIKKEWVEIIAIKRKILWEGGLILGDLVVDDAIGGDRVIIGYGGGDGVVGGVVGVMVLRLGLVDVTVHVTAEEHISDLIIHKWLPKR